jgi:hypothetical protein
VTAANYVRPVIAKLILAGQIKIAEKMKKYF